VEWRRVREPNAPFAGSEPNGRQLAGTFRAPILGGFVRHPKGRCNAGPAAKPMPAYRSIACVTQKTRRFWKLEATVNCRSCRTPRYSPAMHMIRLTEERGPRLTFGCTRTRSDKHASSVQQPLHMFFIALSVRAFSAASGSADVPNSAAGVLGVADLS
jgi:hypothetical protein